MLITTVLAAGMGEAGAFFFKKKEIETNASVSVEAEELEHIPEGLTEG